MKANAKVMAATAAALFVAHASVAAGAEDAQVRCEGVNSCKGRSACRSTAHTCAGRNTCKGRGFLLLTDSECAAAKAPAKPSK